ncbi:hypothetical protein Mapa_005940 [Marchantia paleacea]|nr:hypothetical protein Mapa_005940 [Marchantia paleacea]
MPPARFPSLLISTPEAPRALVPPAPLSTPVVLLLSDPSQAEHSTAPLKRFQPRPPSLPEDRARSICKFDPQTVKHPIPHSALVHPISPEPHPRPHTPTARSG